MIYETRADHWSGCVGVATRLRLSTPIPQVDSSRGSPRSQRKELKAGIRVRYEHVAGKGATKVVILPVKQDGARQEDAAAKVAALILGTE